MSTLLFLAFMAPISLVWHPQVLDANGNCIAEPGTYSALYCSGVVPHGPVVHKHKQKR